MRSRPKTMALRQKKSWTRSPMKELREHTYFVDRELGSRFPALLRSAGLKVERLDDDFPPSTPDESAKVFLHWLRRIDRVATSEPKAFIAKVRKDGVHMWCRHADWLKAI